MPQRPTAKPSWLKPVKPRMPIAAPQIAPFARKPGKPTQTAKPAQKLPQRKPGPLNGGTCVACEGTGVSSRGGDCVPCGGSGAKK